ncbi:major facilitator superfamily domain-containing protein [Biscogniauxia mediterranea]|nr:major facilitator superfamily domain-containing protein [Biscogniauxia mediterranea]
MTINRFVEDDRGSSSFSRPDPESLELIRDDDNDDNDDNDDDDDDEKPQASSPVRWRDLPNKDQLFILSLCRLSEPLSNVCILPYVFFLVRSVLLSSSPSPPHTNPENNDDDDTATATASRISVYSGLLVSSFPLAQCATSLAWGALSDRRGRRPAIAAGLAASALANAGFALASSSFAALLAWRVLAGLANGTVGVARAATAEAVCVRRGGDPRFRARAFLLLPLVFNAGVAASLALGGCLADPVANLPWLFGPDGWLNTGRDPRGVAWALEHPYALPPLLNAAVLGGVLVLAVLGLRETLPAREAHDDVGLRAGAAVARWASRCWTRCRRRRRPREHGYAEIGNEEERLAGEPQQVPTKQPGRFGGVASRGIWTRKVLCALVSFGLLPLHNSAFMHIFPVYLSSPPSSSDGNNSSSSSSSESTLFAFAGGLGLRSSAIGLWLSAFGVGGILLQLFIYPRLQARIGTRGVFRVALWLFPPTYAAAPYLSLVSAGGVKWAFLACVVCAQIAARTMAIPSTVILLTEAAPERAVLGTVHGAGNTLASLARAVGPAVGGYVFALGVDAGVVGLVWWFYLVVIALCALAWSYIMEGDG